MVINRKGGGVNYQTLLLFTNVNRLTKDPLSWWRRSQCMHNNTYHPLCGCGAWLNKNRGLQRLTKAPRLSQRLAQGEFQKCYRLTDRLERKNCIIVMDKENQTKKIMKATLPQIGSMVFAQ